MVSIRNPTKMCSAHCPLNFSDGQSAPLSKINRVCPIDSGTLRLALLNRLGLVERLHFFALIRRLLPGSTLDWVLQQISKGENG